MFFVIMRMKMREKVTSFKMIKDKSNFKPYVSFSSGVKPACLGKVTRSQGRRNYSFIDLKYVLKIWSVGLSCSSLFLMHKRHDI